MPVPAGSRPDAARCSWPSFPPGPGGGCGSSAACTPSSSVVPYGEVFSADPSGQHILIFSVGILSTKTVYTTPPQVVTISPPPESSGTPRTLTLPPFKSVQAKTDGFFARLDNGRVTKLPSPAQDLTEFGAW